MLNNSWWFSLFWSSVLIDYCKEKLPVDVDHSWKENNGSFCPELNTVHNNLPCDDKHWRHRLTVHFKVTLLQTAFLSCVLHVSSLPHNLLGQSHAVLLSHAWSSHVGMEALLKFGLNFFIRNTSWEKLSSQLVN